MSSPSTPALASPLQPHHIRNLILILRRANAHYTHVAARIRATLRPTRHAHRRAQHLGLTVDVAAAIKCPQKQVSNIPLPILEIAPVPVATAPPPYPLFDSSVDGHLPRKTRPALKCAIPSTVLTRTTPNGTTSALSSGSLYSTITLSSAAPTQHSSAAIRYSSRWFATEDEGYPRNATEAGAGSVRAPPAMQGVQVQPETHWQPLDVLIDEDAMDWGLELQYPEDVCDMDVSPSTSGSETNSDSTTSSAGPATPLETLPLMIRIKRKSMAVCDDESLEKRPRVYYDDDMMQPQRRNVIRIPARR